MCRWARLVGLQDGHNLRMKNLNLLSLSVFLAAALSLPGLQAQETKPDTRPDPVLERRLAELDAKLQKLQTALDDLEAKTPVLECHTVTRMSEPLLGEESITVVPGPESAGYTLVSGGCAYTDPQKYERPALINSIFADNQWQCTYKSSRPGRIKATATYCKASVKP